MILVPALAVVQILKLRAEQNSDLTSLKVRRELNLQCRELVETCQMFASNGDSANECGKVLEYGKICLYPLTVVAS